MRLFSTGLLLAGAALLAPAEIRFNRDVRPIMAGTCFRCHGPDKNARMAGMRLDLRDQALEKTASGVVPIVPGQPDQSAIIQRIFATSARIMPPKSAHKELSDAQKQTLRQWVAEGARYEGHWAWQPVERPAVPGAGHPVDAFIRARLAAAGLPPSPPANPRTLLRRVTLDLTGLPPSPAEMDAFLADREPGAYERVVDRLLASPRHAEKQAQHWLDAVRYADTAGFHGDNPWPAWPYRDYVLRAFRDNLPFDRFTREQLAGDLLPDATRDQKVASAYNRLNRVSAEGGLQPKEYLAKYGADRVRTTSSVWLGITVGCAECHDHKFDPILTKDFYALKAFFADIRETGLVADRGAKAFGSVLPLPDAAQQRQLDALAARLREARDRLAAAAPQARASQLLARYERGELSWQLLQPATATSAAGATLRIHTAADLVDTTYDYRGSLVSERKPAPGLITASGPAADNDTYTVTLQPGRGRWTALGLEAITDESLPGVRLARGSDRLMITGVEVEFAPAPGETSRRIPLSLATANNKFPSPALPAMAVLDGDPATGWGSSVYGEDNLMLALRFAAPLATTARGTLTVRVRHDSEFRRATLGRFRLYLSRAAHSWPAVDRVGLRDPAAPQSGLPADVLQALRAAKFRDPAVQAYLRWSAPRLQPLVVAAATAERDFALLESSLPRVVYTEAVPPVETRILPRGDFLNETGAVVEPAIPEFLGRVNPGRRATRLDLANWIVSPDNPLTARVFVNRTWRQFFGAGLSKSLDDLGSQGEWPSHPELLDWLAADFAAGGWDIRRLIRTIVTSETYRQSSVPTPAMLAQDPDNHLLARQARFRVDAENVRDIALFASGLLEERFGGPSMRPPQPAGYLALLNFPKRDYSASRGAEQYRRGLYLHWQRSFLHPALLTFDAPTREECTVNRVNSNTPLQALVLLNDPVFVEAARVFAQRILTEGGASLEQRLAWAFSRAVSRPPAAEETRILGDLYRTSLEAFRAGPGAAAALTGAGEAPAPPGLPPDPETAAMALVARAILNLHETITRN